MNVIIEGAIYLLHWSYPIEITPPFTSEGRWPPPLLPLPEKYSLSVPLPFLWWYHMLYSSHWSNPGMFDQLLDIPYPGGSNWISIWGHCFTTEGDQIGPGFGQNLPLLHKSISEYAFGHPSCRSLNASHHLFWQSSSIYLHTQRDWIDIKYNHCINQSKTYQFKWSPSYP